MSKFTFGPLISRRFGLSLGIDLSPSIKQCNFDCLYCELKPRKAMTQQEIIEDVKEIVEDVKKSIKPDLDVLTITANGEPTMFAKLNKLTKELNKIKNDAKLLILSNGSTICNKKTKKALKKYDIVKLSLDAVSKNVFKKIDRADSNINIKKLIKHMIKFRAKYKKELILEVLFVKGINDSNSEIKLLAKTIKKISPNRVDIGTIDRPPAFDVEPISSQRLFEIKEMFDDLNVNVIYAKKSDIKKLYYTKNDILNTISKRPLTISDADMLFDEQSLQHLKELKNDNSIKQKNISGVLFFIPNKL
jgi:wyosine [tRNA(Phe)-imidazoG37] synthetase (radical SAM superfamily)